MTQSMFSPSWYRVADLQPSLRSHAKIHRHYYRGKLWYVLQDQSSGRFHRFSSASYYIIGLMNGQRRIQDIWDLTTEHLGDDAPTQEEIIQLFRQLHTADALQCDTSPDSLELFNRYEKQQRQKWKQRLWSPLSIRFPLVDPEKFLSRWVGVVRPFYSGFGLLLWCFIVGIGAFFAAMHVTELSANVFDRVLSPQNLFLLVLIYPVVKLCHELGHAFAVKVWGGEVHELGIMLLVFMPVPYVEASAASAFREKHRRMIVGAAGIIVELLLASLAMMVWMSVEEGIVRVIAFNVMLIGGISTLFFNGNPLLRFDGYYVLADAIEIPNLGNRANKYLMYLCQRYLFGMRDAESPVSAPGERTWFLFYGIAAFLYRMFILFVIILFVAGKFFIIGILLAIWAFVTSIFVPLGKALKFIFTNAKLRPKRVRAMLVSLMLVVALGYGIFYHPASLWTRAEGVIWLPDQAEVRTETEGFVRQVLVSPNALVKPGDALIELEDPLLASEVNVLEHRLAELKARYNAQWFDRVKTQIIQEEMTAVVAELAHAKARMDSLIVHSQAAGVFIVPRAQDLPGRYFQKGQLLAYVIDRSSISARVVVQQEDIGLVREGYDKVELKLSNHIEQTYLTVMQREVPEASSQLPSVALGTGGGGSIAVSPSDQQGKTALKSVFQIDFRYPENAPVVDNIGGRVYVRFDHGTEPLAQQWYRLLRQLFLTQFNV